MTIPDGVISRLCHNNKLDGESTLNRQDNAASASTEAGKSGSANCLPLGTRLAEFEITGVIGEGGFGIVYRAVDHSLQRIVALKEYMPGGMAGRDETHKVLVRSPRHEETFATGLKSFINEARLLAQFDHPALIKVYRFWEENNTGYMAMRYYEGQTLKNVIVASPALINEAWLKAMLKPLLEALDALYRVNILHRDVSPDNIMIQENGDAVLLDFGAARQVIGDMTQALTVILKPGYAPIEQYAEDASMKQGPWTDIYSLCAVVYFAITKKAPPSSVARIMKDPIVHLVDGNHVGYSHEFLAAIDSGLAVKPDDRPQSIDAFRRLLTLELSVPQPLQQSTAAIATSRVPEDERTIVLARSSDKKIDKQGDSKPGVHLDKKASPTVASGSGEKSKSSMAGSGRMTPQFKWMVIGAIVAIVVIGGYFSDSGKPAGNPLTASTASASVSASLPAVVDAPRESTTPKTAGNEQVVSDETIAWETLREKKAVTEAELAAFIQKYPSGEFAAQASQKLAEMKAKTADANVKVGPGDSTTTTDPVKDVAPVKPAGSIRLAIKPWGAVFVDGAAKGVSPPVKRLFLPEGQHQIKIVNSNFPAYVVDIEVGKKGVVNVEHDFSAVRK